jgi:Mg-chelatase subunit ChlI
MSLTKIANREPLTKEDIIAAAEELVGLEKQAADADAYGRQMAHKYVDELVKQAEEEKKEEEEETEEEKKEREAKEKKMEKKSSDQELTSAIETLRKLGIVK